MREDFSEFHMPLRVPQVFPPDGGKLVDLLCRRMTDGMLRFIAEADYGYDAREHMKELRKLVNLRYVPGPMAWAPREALELASCTHYGWQDKRKIGKTDFYHASAFCCAARLQATDRFGEGSDGAVLPDLVECLEHLDSETHEAAASFFSHRVPRLKPWDEGYGLYALLLASLAGRLPLDWVSSEALKECEEWAAKCCGAHDEWSVTERNLPAVLGRVMAKPHKKIAEFASGGIRNSARFRAMCETLGR
jgi:hypothetical protein